MINMDARYPLRFGVSAVIARVSPLMHAHVIPNGTYRFSDEEEPGRMYAAAS